MLIGGRWRLYQTRLRADATRMYGNAVGGNDRLIGGDDAYRNYLYGDAAIHVW